MDEAIEQIKKTIDVLSFFEMRSKKLREELDFFQESDNNSMHIGALIRLNHEVMYLCVDAYSLHEGISKKKSLYSKIIKNNASTLSKVDKTEYSTAENIIHLGHFASSGKREATHKEKVESAKEINRISFQSRKDIKEDSGITSSKHCDLDQWLEGIQDEESVRRLHDFRHDFAHRLDSLDNIVKELELPGYENIDQRLSVVSTVIEDYKRRLQNILVYTTSCCHEGFVGIEYDSISRLKQYIELETIIEIGRNNLMS
ncbi:MAG: hypothetical protein HC852_14290 [Acaryochloridaceae cyanobacterium RU_4_10]|nr:hypothetical protein [Acaryochloridaceae cyanobacterium RU_4_10]